MAVSNEISGVQEQNIECASVQFYLGYWRDLSGSGIYQAHAALNSQKQDLNISKIKINSL